MTVDDWVGAIPNVLTRIEQDTSVGHLTLTVISCELTRLFTFEEGRNDFIVAAFDGCGNYLRSHGLMLPG